jgi:hypothetical protein
MAKSYLTAYQNILIFDNNKKPDYIINMMNSGNNNKASAFTAFAAAAINIAVAVRFIILLPV